MTVIARRLLRVRMPTGSADMEIRIHAPVETDHWVCAYEIDWPGAPRRFYGAGANSMQALVIALQMIGAELYTSTAHKEGLLSGADGSQGYGFPVSQNIRPDLIGDDAKYL